MKPTTFNSLQKIGYLIRFHRRQRGHTQTEMANEVGISFRNLQRLENGEVEPKLETLRMIASYMNISISSLIRPTDADILYIREVSTIKEFQDYQAINAKSLVCNDDLELVQKIIQQDQLDVSGVDQSLSATLDGSKVTLSEELIRLTGVSRNINNVDDFIACGTSMERWEYIFRAKLTKAHIQNFYFFPVGFKVFEEFHYNLKPNPDAPTSECYIRDITLRHGLEDWLKKVYYSAR